MRQIKRWLKRDFVFDTPAWIENGEEEILPDPTSRPLADGWGAGVAKALERRINAVIQEGAQIDIYERL